jgi:hypothetical protein
MVTSTAMLLYLLALVGLTVLKYKVYGFAFRMLLGLEIVVIAIFIEAILGFRINRLIDNDINPTHN